MTQETRQEILELVDEITRLAASVYAYREQVKVSEQQLTNARLKLITLLEEQGDKRK